MGKPMRVLDLFCGAGGASVGYQRAGATEIVGVDYTPQPNYPFEFIQYDLSNPDASFDLDFFAFDLIHASPPCQVHSTLRAVQDDTYLERHVDLVAQTRNLLEASGVPYVIENVVGAPLIDPVTLCGTGFGLTVEWEGATFELRRHRIFEVSFPLWGQPACRHEHRPMGVYGDLGQSPRLNNAKRRPNGDIKAGIPQAETLMGIDWMHPKELVQAIPPAFSQYIGEQYAIQHITVG